MLKYDNNMKTIILTLFLLLSTIQAEDFIDPTVSVDRLIKEDLTEETTKFKILSATGPAKLDIDLTGKNTDSYAINQKGSFEEVKALEAGTRFGITIGPYKLYSEMLYGVGDVERRIKSGLKIKISECTTVNFSYSNIKFDDSQQLNPIDSFLVGVTVISF